MKKKIIFNSLIFSFLIILYSFQITEIIDYCKEDEAKKKCTELLKDYKYDLSKITKFSSKESIQKKVYEIPVYFGEKYKLIWSTIGSPEKVEVAIYSKGPESKNRELLFSNKNIPANQTEFTFSPDKSKKMFLEYTIPAATVAKKGCIVFMMGFEVKKIVTKK